MRAYFFGNMYLSSIQQGIQAAHVVGDIFVKCQGTVQMLNALEWAENHKTMILLNAGYADEILSLEQLFSSKDNPYPYAMFREEEASLNNAPTSIGIILPERIYNTAAAIRKDRTPNREAIRDIVRTNEVRWWVGDEQFVVPVSDFDIDLMQRMNQYGMAS